MRRKACSSDPLWPSQLWRCCICLIPWKLRGWSDPPLIHKKYHQDWPDDSPGFPFLCSLLETANTESVLFVCLLKPFSQHSFHGSSHCKASSKGSWGRQQELSSATLHRTTEKHATHKAGGHREKQQSYRRNPGSRSKTCCECCSDEQWDRYAEEWKRQKKSSDTEVREGLQLRTGMDVIRLHEGEGEMK